MTAADLLTLSSSRLDALFKTLPCGPIPDGPATGTAIVGASASVAQLIGRAWKGKVFDAKNGTLTNRLFWNVTAIAAQVSVAPSLLDQQPCILIDYSQSRIVKGVRDELRQVRDTLYLGKVYSGGKPLAHFALEMTR